MEPQPGGQSRRQSRGQSHSTEQKPPDAPARREKKEREEQCEEKGGSSGQRGEVILCDFCLQEPQPAVKTCLSCEASLCQAHLSKHSTKTPLKDHVLMDPCDDRALAERRCPQHSKLLECYCETDSVCICVLCSVTSSHREHKIISLEEAFDQVQSIFPETLETVKKHETALNESIANLLKQEEEVKTKESLQRNQMKSLVKEMCLQLDKNKTEVLKVLSHSKEQQLSKIQAEIEKQKKEKDAASHDVQKLEALRNQKDLLLFMKEFSAIQYRKHNPVPNKDGVILPKPPIILDESKTHLTLRLFEQFLSDMESLFKQSPVHEHLTITVNQGYGYYSSGTIVTPSSYSDLGFMAVNTHKGVPPVCSDQSFRKGCHFWQVDTSNAKCWKLGIAQASFHCYLEKLDDSLRVFLGSRMITEKHFHTNLKVVGVELHCERNTLTFYNMSVKDGDSSGSLRLIEIVRIPSVHSVYASFGVSSGSLKLL